MMMMMILTHSFTRQWYVIEVAPSDICYHLYTLSRTVLAAVLSRCVNRCYFPQHHVSSTHRLQRHRSKTVNDLQYRCVTSTGYKETSAGPSISTQQLFTDRRRHLHHRPQWSSVPPRTMVVSRADLYTGATNYQSLGRYPLNCCMTLIGSVKISA